MFTIFLITPMNATVFNIALVTKYHSYLVSSSSGQRYIRHIFGYLRRWVLSILNCMVHFGSF